MDPPAQQDYRRALDPYLSPAAVARWKPMTEDVTRACLDDKIESGRIDFVDDLANVVPAVMTLALMGLPLSDWVVYCEPTHAFLYTPPDSPDMPRVVAAALAAGDRMTESIAETPGQPPSRHGERLDRSLDLRGIPPATTTSVTRWFCSSAADSTPQRP